MKASLQRKWSRRTFRRNSQKQHQTTNQPGKECKTVLTLDNSLLEGLRDNTPSDCQDVTQRYNLVDNPTLKAMYKEPTSTTYKFPAFPEGSIHVQELMLKTTVLSYSRSVYTNMHRRNSEKDESPERYRRAEST